MNATAVRTTVVERPRVQGLAEESKLDDESFWVARARRGDADAFERLYRKHIGRTYAVCLRMTSNRHLAEELAQEAFIRAWEKLSLFRGDSAFGTWLHRITVNVVLGALRKHGRSRDFFLDTGEDQVDSAAPPRHPQHRLDLELALEQLPPGARAVFVLHDVEGYQHQEIAELLNVAPGTCKAQLHRARRLMREWLSV